MMTVEKATTTISTVGTYGRLVAAQVTEFIRLSVNQQAMLRRATLAPSQGGKLQIPRLGFSEPVTVWNMHNSSWPAYGTVAPSADGQELTCAVAETKVELDNVVLGAWNVEGERIEQTITQQLAVAFGNDLETAAILADADGSDPYNGTVGAGMLTAFNGWYETARTQGTVYDHEGGSVNGTLFGELWEALPVKYQTNPAEYALFAPPAVVSAWTRYLRSVAHPATSEGWVHETERGQVAYAGGVPLVPVPKIPVNRPGILSQSGVTEGKFTFVILARPKNLIAVYDPEIEWRVGVESDVRRRVVYLRAGFVVGYFNPEEVVVAVNVLPAPATSIGA